MVRSLNPERLDLASLAREQRRIHGSDFVRSYPRLAAAFEGNLDVTQIHWTARGEQRADAAGRPVPWLHLAIRAELPLRCQRCLEPVATHLNLDHSFRFVEDESTAEREDGESEEDVLVFEPLLNLHSLVEDEVLMALPMIPMHEVCLPPTMQAQDHGENKVEPVPNPFAALERLRGRSSEGSKQS